MDKIKTSIGWTRWKRTTIQQISSRSFCMDHEPSRKFGLQVLEEHGRLRARLQRFKSSRGCEYPHVSTVYIFSQRRHSHLYTNIVLFFPSSACSQSDADQFYSIQKNSPRTHIWIEMGFESGHLNSEFGGIYCSRTVTLQSYMHKKLLHQCNRINSEIAEMPCSVTLMGHGVRFTGAASPKL